MVKKGLSFVHSWLREPWRPVKLRVVPLGQPLLLLIARVVTLVRYMVLIVAMLLKYGALALIPIHLSPPLRL